MRTTFSNRQNLWKVARQSTTMRRSQKRSQACLQIGWPAPQLPSRAGGTARRAGRNRSGDALDELLG